MNNFMLNFSGTELSRLRAKVEAVGKEIGVVTGSAPTSQGATPNSALATTWAELLQLLDLGGEPAMQHCPNCQALCMAGANRCGNCWVSLPTSSHRSGAPEVAGKAGAAATG
jgi:hypothetical protein